MRLFHFLKKQNGFTTTELMVAVTITSLFGASFYGAFYTMNTGMWKNNQYFDTGVSAKIVIEHLAKDVQEAINVETSHGGINLADACLILKLPSIDANGVPTNIAAQFDFVTYRINPNDNTQLVRSVDVLGGTSQREGGVDHNDVVVGRKISAVLFQAYTGAGGALQGFSSVAAGTVPTLKYIHVRITAQGTTLGTAQQTWVASDLMLRNHIT